MELEKIYKIVSERDKKVSSLYNELGEYQILFEKILNEIGLPINSETMFALTQRFVNLREDSIINLLRREGFTTTQIQKKQIVIYQYVGEFWLQQHIELIKELKPYLSPFYFELFIGIHNIGISFSDWQIDWTSHIIFDINQSLLEQFNGDEAKVLEMLRSKKLFDEGHEGEADRCYTVLVKENGEYKVKCYSQFFDSHIYTISSQIKSLINRLKKHDDKYKEEWIEYLQKMDEALISTERDKLVEKWSEVDIAWMNIKSPIQVGHPLEYYEDRFRKAVALELDIRVQNPNLKSEVKENIVKMYKKYNSDIKTLQFALKKIEDTQLYLSRPATFYGAEFNGLFSAQVVPNDEVASSLKGKKIFAFADKILEDSKSKPKMRIHYEVFGEKFMEKQYQALENRELWYKLYDITTIGHEFGHILWLDSDTESKMNQSGAFKNVEEFKATTGGLLSFFENESEELKEIIINDTIKRAVTLIAWKEVGEVLPYYIEGLIHLTALFETKILIFEDNHLKIDYNLEKYEKIKVWYKNVYLDLVKNFYIPKRDPIYFLEEFVLKDRNFYMPQHRKVYQFVDYYYELYKRIGQIKYEQ